VGLVQNKGWGNEVDLYPPIRIVMFMIWGLSGVVAHFHVFERDFSLDDPRLCRSFSVDIHSKGGLLAVISHPLTHEQFVVPLSLLGLH
jgi:hypothetical protein